MKVDMFPRFPSDSREWSVQEHMDSAYPRLKQCASAYLKRVHQSLGGTMMTKALSILDSHRMPSGPNENDHNGIVYFALLTRKFAWVVMGKSILVICFLLSMVFTGGADEHITKLRDLYSSAHPQLCPFSFSACEKNQIKKDIMSSKSKDDDHPLTSFKTMPLLSQYYQSIVSVQFTSGWREYWGVMDQNKIYLCYTPC